MSSDYRGGQPPLHPPQQPYIPQQGSSQQPGYQPGHQPGYMGAPGYGNESGNPGNSGNPGVATPMSAPARQQSAPYPPHSPGSQPPHVQPTPTEATPLQNWDPLAKVKARSPKRRRWLIPVVVVMLLALLAAGAVYIIGQKAIQEPLATANAFCNDLKAQNYSDAYALLSAGYQAQVTAQDFAQISQLHDQLDGKVQQCGLAGVQGKGGFNLNLNPQSVSFDAQMTRRRTYTGAVTLVKHNGSWKINALDDSLQGSDVGAFTTGNLFCQALASQNYATVYGMFTPAYQQQIGSASNYANGLKQVFGSGQFQITSCQPQMDTYTVTAQDDRASLSGSFNIKVTTDAGALTVPVPFKIAFAKIAGTWKISDLEVVQSQG